MGGGKGRGAGGSRSLGSKRSPCAPCKARFPWGLGFRVRVRGLGLAIQERKNLEISHPVLHPVQQGRIFKESSDLAVAVLGRVKPLGL